MHKALDFNTTILLGNNCTNVPAESPFAEDFTHSFSIFERKEFHCPVYNDKASFIIELNYQVQLALPPLATQSAPNVLSTLQELLHVDCNQN